MHDDALWYRGDGALWRSRAVACLCRSPPPAAAGCKRHGADGRDHVSVSGSLLDKLDDAIKERELNHLVGGPGHAEL